MSFSISHIEVDFLIWAKFSNCMLFFILLLLLFCNGIVIVGYFKAKKSIYKKNKKYFNNKDSIHDANNSIDQNDFKEFFPIFLKKHFIKKCMGLSNIRTYGFLRIMEFELKEANNRFLGILLIIFITFSVPFLDFLSQYLFCFGEGTDMNYLGTVSLRMFLLSKYTVQRILLFIIDGIMTGVLLFFYKKYLHQIINYLNSFDLIKNK